MGASARGVLHGHAWLAPVHLVGDVERIVVCERGLDARPRAHVDADLLAHVAGQGLVVKVRMPAQM